MPDHITPLNQWVSDIVVVGDDLWIMVTSIDANVKTERMLVTKTV